MKATAIALALVIGLILLIFGPWVTFWTIQTLTAPGADFGFKEWLAAIFFGLMLAGAGSARK